MNESVWTGRTDDRNDRRAFRYHQVVEMKSVSDVQAGVALIGFACEEGVRRNKGRPGAALAPKALRSELAKLPWRFPKDCCLTDTGDISCIGEELEAAQQELGEAVRTVLANGARSIILGGGHETLYGHYLGVRSFLGPDAKVGLINIDAHFDLRPYDEQTSSGTMFRQILEQDDNTGYFVAGIQRYGNTQELFDRADSLGVTYLYEDDLIPGQLHELHEALHNFIDRHDAVLLTLCTDVLNAAYAPGVSAPSPFGLSPSVVRDIIRTVTAHEKTQSFDISEVNPLLDENGRTVKLGAYFVNEAIAGFVERPEE